MINKLDRYIARNIICAKIASDAGKGYYDTVIANVDLCNSVQSAGYSTKDGFILEAIKAIKGTPNSAFRFWAEQRPDQNGNKSVIVYFETKIHGKRKQISFHTFSQKVASYTNKGRKTRWTHQSPQDTIVICNEIIAFYDL